MGADEKNNSDGITGSLARSESIRHGDMERAYTPEKLVATDDVDEALVFLGTGDRMVFTEEQNRKLLWKIGQFIAGRRVTF
jgi:hypothetical protein